MRKYLVLFLMLINACTVSLNENSFSLLENSECNLPCWNNINIDKTTKEALITVLEESSFTHQYSVRSTPGKLFDESFLFQIYSTSEQTNRPMANAIIQIKDGVVGSMQFCGALNLTIGEIVELSGAPQDILSYDGPNGTTRVEGINSLMGIDFWYDTNSISESARMELQPEVQVFCLNIFSPNYYEKMVDGGFFTYSGVDLVNGLRAWAGYGNIEELYNP